jgi:hypothetical protein
LSYLKDIQHEEYLGYKTRTKFKTLTEARDFVKEVLCPNLPRDSHRKTIVDVIDCVNKKSKEGS